MSFASVAILAPVHYSKPYSSPIATMPGFHVTLGANAEDDTMVAHSSINKTMMGRYSSRSPMGEFKFPMDNMQQLPGTVNMDYDSLLAHLRTKSYWWIGRAYKNFSGNLDLYIRWSYADRVHLYVLEFDPLSVQIGDEYELYPTPRDWYRARTAINTGESWTLAEYDAMAVPWTDDEPIAADPIEAAGGTVFLCMVCFFFHFCPGPASFMISYCSDYSLFWFVLCFLLLFRF